MLSIYAKENGWKDFNKFKKLWYDELGNRTVNAVTERYEKRSDGKWYKDESWESIKSNIFVIDGQIYERFVGDESLMPLNMDFNSSTCGVYWKLIKEIKNTEVKITNNEIIYSSDIIDLYIHKQSYSDNTCFYSIIRGNSRDANVNECGDNIDDILTVFQRDLSWHNENKYPCSLEYKQALEDVIKHLETLKCE